MLRLHQIARRQGGRAILHDVSVTVAAGECALVLETPDGKASTLLQVAATLIAPDAGTVVIDGIDAISNPFVARQRVAYVGPQPMPWPSGATLRDLALLARAGRRTRSSSDFMGAVLSHAGTTALEPVHETGQPVIMAAMIAVTLDSGAPVIVLDNPFASLDDEWTGRVRSWVGDVVAGGTAALMSAGDPAVGPAGSRVVRLD